MKRSLIQIVCDAVRLFYNDIKTAKWAIMMIIAYFVIFRRFLYSMCPMVVVTGFPCPACGLTRAGFRVLHLDLAGAWRIHPFIYPIIVLILVFCVRRYILQKKNMEMLKWCVIIVMIGMILFYIWRMIRYFPGEPPMSYYYHNLLRRLWDAVVAVSGA